MTTSEVQIDLGTTTMTCTPNEIGSTLAAFLGEMRGVLPMLRHDEREVLRRIMDSESCALTVGDVFPDFTRESEAHKTLRRLRAAQFIRPAEHGRWDPDEHIEVKPFARLMWDHIGEDEIFNIHIKGVEQVETPHAKPAAPEEVVVDLGEEDEVVDLGTEDEVVDLAGVEPVEKPTPKPTRNAADQTAKWDDEVVMSLLNDSEDDESSR